MNQTARKIKKHLWVLLKFLINDILHSTEQTHLSNPKIKRACKTYWRVNAGKVIGQALKMLEGSPPQKPKIKSSDEVAARML